MLILGLDMGTTSICAVVYDTEEERVVEAVNRANDSLLSEEGGCHMQDAQRILDIVYELTHRLCRDFCIKAIGVTGQMHGIVYVDENADAVSPLITWKDKRGEDLYAGQESYAAYLTSHTGHVFHAGYGLVSHFYYQKGNAIPQEAKSLATIADYVAWKLAGAGVGRMEASMAASLGGFLLEEGCFDKAALESAGMDIDYLPRILKAGESACLGYHQGIPVYAACGDNQASFLSAVEKHEEGVCVNVGTGAQVSVFHRDIIQTEGVDIRPFFGKGFLYVGASINGGKAYALLGEFYREICQCFTGLQIEPYEIMNRLSQSCEDTGGLRMEPFFYGTRGEEKRRGEITGISPENLHVPELTRALVTGMAEELQGMYLSFPPRVRQGRQYIYGGGNGMRRNALLQAEVARIFQMHTTMSLHVEEAAVGAALAAGYYGKEELGES